MGQFHAVCYVRHLAMKNFLLLNILPCRTPLILKPDVQRLPVDVLGPPLSPARQEDLLRVLWEVISIKSTENTSSTCLKISNALSSASVFYSNLPSGTDFASGIF